MDAGLSGFQRFTESVITDSAIAEDDGPVDRYHRLTPQQQSRVVVFFDSAQMLLSHAALELHNAGLNTSNRHVVQGFLQFLHLSVVTNTAREVSRLLSVMTRLS
jgi:hypothetical protein